MKFNEDFNSNIEKYEMTSVDTKDPYNGDDDHLKVKTEAVKLLIRGLQRPFTLSDLIPQVKDIPKKEFEPIFTALVESREVIMKLHGKMKIYYYNYKLNAVKVIPTN